jgi:hypothetical protein
MIDVTSCIFQRCGNVFVLKIGKIAKDFRATRPTSQKIQDVRDTDTLAANAGPPAENLRIGGDPIEMAHRCTVDLALPLCREMILARIAAVRRNCPMVHTFGGGGGAVK